MKAKNLPRLAGGRVVCTCGTPQPVVATAYGHKATCPPCGVRWTRLHRETAWTKEAA